MNAATSSSPSDNSSGKHSGPRVHYTVEPVFHIDISPTLLAGLLLASNAHYDAVCRRQAEQGGLLYGWHNMATIMQTVEPRAIAVELHRSDADGLLKVCENRSCLQIDQATAVFGLTRVLIEALDQAEACLGHLKFPVAA